MTKDEAKIASGNAIAALQADGFNGAYVVTTNRDEACLFIRGS
jgi:hypothetical protein